MGKWDNRRETLPIGICFESAIIAVNKVFWKIGVYFLHLFMFRVVRYNIFV